jgi:hypothetical protein
VKLSQFRVGQDIAGTEVALASQIERDELKFEGFGPGRGRQHLEALGRHFRADSVASHDSELDQKRLRPIAVISIAGLHAIRGHHLAQWP